MNILFVLSLGFDRPGPSIHLLTGLMEALVRQGHRLTVVEKITGGPEAHLPPVLEETGMVKVRPILMPLPKKDRFITRYINQMNYVRLARKQMAGQYDWVYIHSCQTLYPLVKAARRLCPGAKVAVNVQDIFPENAAAVGMMKKDSFLYRMLAGPQAKAYRGADRVITLSQDMKDTLVKAGADARKVKVIPPWTYSDSLQAVPEEKNIFLKEHPQVKDKFRVVYAGNVGKMQNVEMLLDSARLLKHLPQVHFMIVGGGAKAKTLEEKARAMDLENMGFYPMQPSERAPHVYSMADINLIPLAPGVAATAFPSKTAICCAVARPVLASVDEDSHYAGMLADCDGCAVTPAGDAKELAKAVERLYYLGGQATSRGLRALYQGFLSQERCLDQHIRLFEGREEEGR